MQFIVGCIGFISLIIFFISLFGEGLADPDAGDFEARYNNPNPGPDGYSWKSYHKWRKESGILDKIERRERFFTGLMKISAAVTLGSMLLLIILIIFGVGGSSC